MVTSATTQAESEKLTSLAPWADTVSKTVAALAIALYACGFLVVSLYHSKFGFVGVTLFRPRILAAGAWFFFFTSIPASIAVRYKSSSWSSIGRNAYTIWVACLGISVPFIYFLFNTSDYAPASPPRKYWWVWLTAILVALGLMTLISQSKRFPPAVSAVASVALALYFAQSALRQAWVEHVFRLDTVTLWFFAVIMVTLVELKILSGRNLAESGEWSKPLVALFVVLLAFAQYFYPHIKASWGGGAPVDVTICFTKDSAISPSKTVSAQLIDEADEGFYIVGTNDSKAIFVPRSAVAFVYFSNKMSDSQLLRDSR
jgi:hypothetical protein